jgi:hypothetical protein
MRAYLAMLALLLAFPMTALAQDTAASAKVVITEESGKTSGVINYDECSASSGNRLRYNWTLAVTAGSTNLTGTDTVSLKVSTDSNCPTTSGSAWSVTVTANQSDPLVGKYPIIATFNESLEAVREKVGVRCDDTTTTVLYACASATSSSDTATKYSAVGSIKFDPTLPPPPTLNFVDQGEGSLTAHFSAGATGDTRYPAASSRFYATAKRSDGQGSEISSVQVTGGTAQITGLTNDIDYNVVVYAISDSGNKGPASNQQVAHPVPVDDFWKLYRQSGREEGGCSSGPAGMLALLVPVFFALRRRRS